ncbi:MAG: DUF4381 family protein [Proteobacteria bacterium]|nr:DUF4381 family protein [Pseudomonadota bacterium]NBP15987.1 DUF4381 family protein [bacterium]
MQSIEIKDIYDISYQPFWKETWFFLLAIIVCSSLIGVIVYWLYKKQQKKVQPQYWQIALYHLQHIKDQNIQDSAFVYAALTTIIKQYLQTRYAVPLVALTDDQFIAALKNNSCFDTATKQAIKELFNDVVLIKFAQQQAAQQQIVDAIEKAIALIGKTKTIENQLL